MKLAYFSPLNPQPSGISDYSEELLPYLAAHADIDLFVDGFRPSNLELRERFRSFDYAKDPATLNRLRDCDAVVYHVGNDHRYHSGIFSVMRRHPGVAVFHEFVLHDFFLGQAHELNDMSLYLEELEACYGALERAKAEEAIQRGELPPQAAAPLDYPLNCRLARSAEGIIAHSNWNLAQLKRAAPNVPAVQISMPVKLLSPTLLDAWSRKKPGRRVISLASFGQIIPRKALPQILNALAGLKEEFDFHYTLVGAENPYFDVRALIIDSGMSERVTITGHVSLEEFERQIAATDIAINLREYTVGETSASLSRIMGSGVPAIVSDLGWFSEIPDECVVKITPDDNLVAALQAGLRRLMADESLRTRMGKSARQFVMKEHNIWRTAERYMAFIGEVIARRSPAKVRDAGAVAKPTSTIATSTLNKPSMPVEEPNRGPITTSIAGASPKSPAERSRSRAVGEEQVASRPLKLAYFSPLNPQPSGISDYSEELLPHLATRAQLDLFVDGFKPDNPEVTTNFRVIDYRRNPSVLQQLAEYDAVVYHLGNDHRYHAGIFRVMQRHPGIAVFHDFALQDFFLGLAREEGQLSFYLDELEACHGKRERRRAAEYLQRGAEPPHPAAALDFPLNCRVARAAEGIVVHSEWSRERLLAIAPGVPITRINHHITSRAAATPIRAEDHSADGGSGGPVQIASFGLITREKGIERALRALTRLRDEYDFHYTLVGSSDNYPELPEMIRRLGLEDRVTITGYVTLDEFERRIAEADIAINLRERPVGATSGSLCRIMAAGLPAIVSNVGAFSELPNDAVVKIEHDAYGDALLQAYLRKLIEDTRLRERIGKNARRHMLAEHDIETSAARYVNFIREVIARRPRRQFLGNIADELSVLGIRPGHEALLRGVAAEVAVIAPDRLVSDIAPQQDAGNLARAKTTISGNGHAAAAKPATDAPGRLPKIEGIDYKRAALDYPRLLDAERSYYLKTKPFYNLANKPEKHLGDGMDAETHRHFSDFANMAVALALPAGARILDVGCGSGWLSEYFARLGYDVTGIDISDDLIRMACERLASVPYNVDHETSLRCCFLTHDIEAAPISEKFDAIICYDSLHHFEEEQSVFRNLATMLDVGGLLFILEGRKPPADSATEEELRNVMRAYGTLESPFSDQYLHTLLDKNGFAVVGDYVSVNGLFEREMLEDSADGPTLPLRTLPTDYHYLTCMKVADDAPASSVPDSRNPGVLSAEFMLHNSLPRLVEAGAKFEVPITITNRGDTVWLSGQTVRAGIVMPGLRIIDEQGKIISELHGHPMLPRSVAPGQTIGLNLQCAAPVEPGNYIVRIDLVAQHVCWFEQRGSNPFVFSFQVRREAEGPDQNLQNRER